MKASAEENRMKVFRYIEKTQPTTMYKIAKELGMSYNTIYYIVRDLVFAGVVKYIIKINQENTSFKELTTCDKEENSQ